ncbi:MAG: hypothetical protein ACPGJV_04775 [Bacteriovoracaceae bacterium]
MKFLTMLLLILSFNCDAQIQVHLDPSILDTTQMEFETHTGAENSYANALALNVEYEQVKRLRTIIEQEINRPFKFLTSWQAQGEAHVTTISPPEYKNILRHHISMARINEIAMEKDIQSADLEIHRWS